MSASARDDPRAGDSTDLYDRHYRSGGFGYERRRERWERWVDRHFIGAFGLQPGDSLLDIPCGDGFWSSIFAKAGLQVTGIDLSTAGIEQALGRYPRIEFQVGNAEEPLPFPKEHFDVVFSKGISHLHRRELFTDASRRMIGNLMSYVRPGGLMLVSYTTKRDRSGEDRHHSHPISDLVKLVETAGDPFKVELVRDRVQIGVQRRDAPRLDAGRRRTRRQARD